MPIYEYQCKACGENFEELILGKEEDETPACPKCSSAKTTKLMSAPRRTKSSGNGFDPGFSAASAGGGCAGCPGGDCSSCGG